MASMSANSSPEPTPFPPGDLVPDWAAFYKNFQKPGYIPGFEVGNRLGGGVFGVVYKAKRESIGKPYAIKFLKIEDPSVRNQVLAELDTVQLFAQVDHPNLVSIEDKGVVDGVPYIVMGYAGDETLRTRLEDGSMTTDMALSIFVQAARGVQALHEHSLVHFDLKPANIFLKGDITRVGDYGLSKLVTQTAMSLSSGRGTPYYMAPEMLRRKGDHRADIYSLGIILYECLSGQVPFQGENEWEVLKGHEEKPVEFPDSIEPTYQVVLSRMLAKQPEDRQQSLAEVLRELQAPVHLGDSVQLPKPRSGTAQARKGRGPNTKSPGRQAVEALKPAVARMGREVGEKVTEAVVSLSESMAKTITEGKFWVEMRRVARRWWPWLLVLVGISVMIGETIRDDELALATAILVWGASLGILRLVFALIDRKQPQRAPSKLRTLAGWLPLCLLLLGTTVLVFGSMSHRNEGRAFAIVIMLAGALILGMRGVKWLMRRDRSGA